jgi:GT2 family glycosyltransferase
LPERVTDQAAVVSAIVPTVGRASSLNALLESLAKQTRRPDEVVIADSSGSPEVPALVSDWRERGLAARYLHVTPANAVQQRIAAIAAATGNFLLLLDDDVVLEPPCVERLLATLDADPALVAVSADIVNASWPEATTAWQLYMRSVLGLRAGEWHGRVVGPLLRFGYPVRPSAVAPLEWFAAGHSLVRREAYEAAGGFSSFFLHRSTMNEDVDLALKMSRFGRIALEPASRAHHFHHPHGRVSIAAAAEDDLYNRYLILTRTMGRTAISGFAQALTFFVVENSSNLIGSLRRLRFDGVGARLAGRSRALFRIAASAIRAGS